MSAREVIKMIEALPVSEQRVVLEFCAAKSASTSEAKTTPMSFKEAKSHVFTTYRDLLEKLAK